MDTLEQHDDADSKQQTTTQACKTLSLPELCARGVAIQVEPPKPNLRAIERTIRKGFEDAELNLGVVAENIGGRSEVVVFSLDADGEPDRGLVRTMVRSAFGLARSGAAQQSSALSGDALASMANTLLSKSSDKGRDGGRPVKHSLMLDGQKLLEGRKQNRKTTTIVGDNGWLEGNIGGVLLKSGTLLIEDGGKSRKIAFDCSSMKGPQKLELDELLLPCKTKKIRVPVVLRDDGSQYVPGEALLGALRGPSR